MDQGQLLQFGLWLRRKLLLFAADAVVNIAQAGASIEATRTNFLFTNSWMPMLESSRP
jgi:hypothetical protein